MTYLKSFLAGIGAAFVAVALWTGAVLVVPFVPVMVSEQGGLGATSVGSDSVLLVALIGFGLGFFFMLRRQTRRGSFAA